MTLVCENDQKGCSTLNSFCCIIQGGATEYPAKRKAEEEGRRGKQKKEEITFTNFIIHRKE